MQKNFRTQVQEGSRQQGSRMVTLASEYLKLKCCLEKTIEIITSALRGMHPKWDLDWDCVIQGPRHVSPLSQPELWLKLTAHCPSEISYQCRSWAVELRTAQVHTGLHSQGSLYLDREACPRALRRDNPQ